MNRCSVVLAAVAMGWACAGTEDGLPPSTVFSDMFVEVSQVILAENDTVINVAPSIELAGPHHYLVTDAQEAQVRVYERSGSLVRTIGRPGEGPGEFGVPITGVVRHDTVTIIDLSRGVLRFRFSSGEFIDQLTSPFRVPYRAAHVAEQGQLLVMGRLSPVTLPQMSIDSEYSLLHRFDPTTGEVVASFYTLPEQGAYSDMLSLSYGGGDFSVRGDTIAAMFALSDTLFLGSTSGVEFERLRLRIPHPVPSELPKTNPNDPRTMLALRASLARVNFLHWFPDGRFLVQTLRRSKEETTWHTYLLSRDGELLNWTSAASRAVRAWGDTVLFASPGALLPNRFLLGVVR